MFEKFTNPFKSAERAKAAAQAEAERIMAARGIAAGSFVFVHLGGGQVEKREVVSCYPIIDRQTGEVTDAGFNLGFPAGQEQTFAGTYTTKDVMSIPPAADEEKFKATLANAWRHDELAARTGGNNEETVAE